MKLIMFALLSFPLAAFAAPLTVMVDPGHGGRDNGAVKDGVHEAKITLAVSLRLRDLLRKDRRFEVILSR